PRRQTRYAPLRRPLVLMFASAPFLFYSHRAHRDLHSFPTRRSSDLVRLLQRDRVRRVLGDELPHPVEDRPQPQLQPLARARPPPDRKSTRLNSSHVKISYAVFCLKKKNTHTRAITVQKARPVLRRHQ